MKCDITSVTLDKGRRKDHFLRNLEVEGITIPAIMEWLGAYSDCVTSCQRDPEISHKLGPEKLEKMLRFVLRERERLARGDFIENPDSCYCGLPLTKVPDEMKPVIKKDHLQIKGYIEEGGFHTYDPYEAPFNPTIVRRGDPHDIFDVDNLMVLISRLFEFTNVEASTGAGMELRTSTIYNKAPLVMVKKGIKVSRMPNGVRRGIILQYDDNFGHYASDFIEFVRSLKRFDFGTGQCSVHGNSFIGYEKGSRHPVCMHGLALDALPMMEYVYEG